MNKQLKANIEAMIAKLALAGDAESVYQQLVETGFRRELDNPPTAAQVGVLVDAAIQYGVNPLAGEMYPQLRWDGSVSAVLTREGWNRLAHAQDDFDFAAYEYSPERVTLRPASEANPVALTAHEWIDAVVHRKGRGPFRVREYLDENFKPEAEGGSPYWMISPKRQLRHKAFVSALRSAYSLSSFMEPDEIKQVDSLQKKVAAQSSASAPVAEKAPAPEVGATPEPVAEEAPAPEVDATPEPVAEKAPAPEVDATPEPVAEKAPAPEVDATPEPVAEEAPALRKLSEAELKAARKVLDGVVSRCLVSNEWASSKQWVQTNPKLKANVKAYLLEEIELAERTR